MSRLSTFFNLFSEIYGSEIVDNLFKKKDGTISFNKDEISLTKFIIEYYLDLKYEDKSVIKSCRKCENILKKYFKKRPFEISNWRGNLDFNKKNVKDIILVGEAAGPGIKTHLNFSYGLCNLPIGNNGEINWERVENLYRNVEKKIKNEEKYKGIDVKKEIKSIITKKSIKHKFFEYLYEIFAEPYQNLEKFLNSIYITDMVRCNDSARPEWESNSVWKKCINNCKNFFFEEINLLTPKLILITADSALETFLSLLKENNVEVNNIDISKYLNNFPSRSYGYIMLNGNKIHFYQIYHNKKYYQLEKQEIRPLYKAQNRLLFSNEILPKILQWC